MGERSAGRAEEEEEAEDAPVIRLVHEILEQALAQRASDIHVEPMVDRVRVRYRVDGVCYEAHSLEPDLTGPVITRLKVMAHMDISEHRKPQDGRFTGLYRDGEQLRDVDFRVSVIPGSYGEDVVIRVLDPRRFRLDLDELATLLHHAREFDIVAGYREPAPVNRRQRPVVSLPPQGR